MNTLWTIKAPDRRKSSANRAGHSRTPLKKGRSRRFLIGRSFFHGIRNRRNFAGFGDGFCFGQTGAFGYVIPISIAIAVLLVIVSISYRQTIHAYPTGGGAYIVAKENLGTVPGLVAGASLLVDYVLTVSVSVAAGVAAITSAAQGTQFAWITDHKVAIGVGFIVLIALANLRGVRESGSLFALPTYVFLVSFLFMIGYGIIYYFCTTVSFRHPRRKIFNLPKAICRKV